MKPDEPTNSDTSTPEMELTGQEQITKIADLQRMNIDELNQVARNMGLNLGSLTKSQLVFEIVRAKAEHPTEILVGEGVLEVLPDGVGSTKSTTSRQKKHATEFSLII